MYASREEQRRAAMDKALYYLGLRDRSKKQMSDYLFRKEFSEDIVEEVLDRLAEYGYLDDERYAKRLIEDQTKIRKKGKRATAQKLWQAGIDKETANEALEQLNEEDESVAAAFWAEKLWPRLREDPKGREKLYRRLLSKGFSYDIVKQTVALQMKFEEESFSLE